MARRRPGPRNQRGRPRRNSLQGQIFPAIRKIFRVGSFGDELQLPYTHADGNPQLMGKRRRQTERLVGAAVWPPRGGLHPVKTGPVAARSLDPAKCHPLSCGGHRLERSTRQRRASASPPSWLGERVHPCTARSSRQSTLRAKPGRQRRRAGLVTRRLGELPAALDIRVQFPLMIPVIGQGSMNLA